MNRLWIEYGARAALGFLTAAAVAVLLWILASVALRGGGVIGPSFLLEASAGFGESGGVLYQILGTLLLMTGAAVVAVPLAIGSVLFHTEFTAWPRWNRAFRTLVYSLNAVPTILFGLIGYAVFGVLLDTGVSWLTGALILAVMILPTLHVSFQEAVEAIPVTYREAGRALGLTPWQMILSVVIPQSLPGLVTGILLGLARAAGETAAIMFTATTFSGITWPRSWTDPVPTLQTHILVLAQEAIHPEALARAWGAALVLLTIVFFLIGAALVLRRLRPPEGAR